MKMSKGYLPYEQGAEQYNNFGVLPKPTPLEITQNRDMQRYN
jgi:hypothetical protein